MPIVLNGSTGITTNNLGVETIVDSAGTGAPSVPNGFEQMFVLPVGTLMWFTGTTAPGGYLVADGSLHSRAAYPDLWSWIVTSGNLAVSDAVWTDGQYSPGDGATTFRVPKVDDRFIRGKSSTRAVGLVEEDAFQGHRMGPLSGTGFATTLNSGGGYTGAIGATLVTRSTTGDPVSDDVNGTPRTANETRPKALTMLPCIKAFDSVIEPSVLNAAEMVSTINGKLDKDENINLGEAKTATGTFVDFDVPLGVKRITVMFDGVSTNGTSPVQVQLGNHGSIQTTGYISAASNTATGVSSTTGLVIYGAAAADSRRGTMLINYAGGGLWVASGNNVTGSATSSNFPFGGTVTLLGPLDRLRITTVNDTDQFDAGTINISWEF